MKKITNYLKEERIKKGLSQTDLSKFLGYKSCQHISNFERGLCSLSIKSFVKLSKKFGFDLDKIRSDYIEYTIDEINKQFWSK